MNSRHVLLAALYVAAPVHAADDFRAPDTLVLKDGCTLRGLIVRNTATEVLLQTRHTEESVPKSGILRIIDAHDADAETTQAARKGDLPSWRLIVNDLRVNDAIRSLVEIPAVAIHEGVFRNVPYRSFRANRNIEMNIYGDPEDPAAIELGIFGLAQSNRELRQRLRAYLAGFLASREELAALYAIPLEGGIRRAGRLTFEVTPKDAPDAFGAWWLSIWDEAGIERSRLPDAEYAALTRPEDRIIGRHGRLKKGVLDLGVVRLGSVPEQAVLRGFYRDKDGVFRLLEEH